MKNMKENQRIRDLANVSDDDEKYLKKKNKRVEQEK